MTLLENVTAVEDKDKMKGLSNADEVSNLMNDIGYFVHRVSMSPKDGGVPHRRTSLLHISQLFHLCRSETSITGLVLHAALGAPARASESAIMCLLQAVRLSSCFWQQ